MRSLINLLCLPLAFSTLVSGQDGGVTTVANVQEQPSDKAWLGLELSKPDDAMANQLPVLPPGIGFMVMKLIEGGPAQEAGLKKHDLVWKMNDQMLVNEGQLATLLRLSSPGEEVKISAFRNGKSIEIQMILGSDSSDASKSQERHLMETVLRKQDGAVRTVSLGDKKAVVSNKHGSAEVMRLEDGDAVQILNKKGEIIFEGTLRGSSSKSAVPKEWKRPICAMRRSLDLALNAKEAPKNQPRPRIVVPEVEN